MMKTDQPTPKTVDAYIAGFPPAIQAILQQIRATIRTAAPDAAETIKYQMPTYVLIGELVQFRVAENQAKASTKSKQQSRRKG